MKQVTDNFKNDIKTYGRQFNFEIKINDVDVSDDDINYIKPSFNSTLFQTIMHQIEIDSKNKIPLKSTIKVRAGVKVNEPDYEYISYNTCIVNSSEKQEDNNSYVSLAYDKMIESMIDYDLTISEKITLREYLIKICERLGWNTNNIPATFINSDKLVDPRLHVGIEYTFRDVLDEIATISCSFLLFKGEDFVLVYPTDVNQNIDNEYLNEDNVTIGEKFFINSLIFSRAEESDNIYRKDETNIQLNGLHEYRISDNQLLSTNDRDLYIDDMFNYLKTFEFYIFDVSSKGILFLEACDRFNFVLSDNTYSTILLNNEIAFEDGLSENLYIDKPTETETEYKYADTTDKRINQTYILVDKQNQKIESVITNVTEQNNKISQVTQTVDELNSKISDIADITTSQESMYGKVSFEKVNQSEPIRMVVRPIGESISYLYPHNNLFPSDTLLLKNRKIRFENTKTGKTTDYELPDDLLYCEAESEPQVITWDGDTTDRESLTTNLGLILYKVSDLTPTKEELSGQKMYVKDTNGNINEVLTNDLSVANLEENNENVYGLDFGGGMFYVLIVKETTIINETSCTPGIYFFYMNWDGATGYVTELTLPAKEAGDVKNYDEFILDYDGQSCVINKRVGYNADGTKYLLDNPTTIEYEYPKIELEDGDYTVELLGYTNAYLLVRLMAQNIYTTQFATKAEVKSEISQKADEIDISVDKKLENYSTTTQMNSAINVKANEITSNVSTTYETKANAQTQYSQIKQTTDNINLEVGKKVNNEDFNGANIMLAINDDTSSAQINADKISLKRKTN